MVGNPRVFHGKSQVSVPGGAGNVVSNIRALGGISPAFLQGWNGRCIHSVYPEVDAEGDIDALYSDMCGQRDQCKDTVL